MFMYVLKYFGMKWKVICMHKNKNNLKKVITPLYGPTY